MGKGFWEHPSHRKGRVREWVLGGQGEGKRVLGFLIRCRAHGMHKRAAREPFAVSSCG